MTITEEIRTAATRLRQPGQNRQPVAEPLADLLDSEASIFELIPADRQGACVPERALAVARALNASA